jgi:hypothetical protein
MYPASILALLCDASFAIIPMFLIRTLQLDRKPKIALRVILGMACVYVFSTYRKPRNPLINMPYRASIAVVARIPVLHYLDEPDFLCLSNLSNNFLGTDLFDLI